MMARSSSQNPLSSEPTPTVRTLSERWWRLLPMTHQDIRERVACYDNLGKEKIHGKEQRYVSPTTGVCRKLVIQSVQPSGPNECPIRDHTGHMNRVALRLCSNNIFHPRKFFRWIGDWFLFTFMLLWLLIMLCVQLVELYVLLCLGMDPTDDLWEDSEVYDTGYYKPYPRKFDRQLWAARSKVEHSTRANGEDQKERNVITHSLHPRVLMMHDSNRDEWFLCTVPNTITSKKYIAISYRATDVDPGADKEREEELFIQEVRLAALQQNFDAYWLDLECIGKTQEEKNRDIYCMADVYRGAESTLIILGNSKEGEQAAWERWGTRVWTLPEALLSHRLLYKFRDRSEINPISLHQLANFAYPRHPSEQAVINAYSGKDPLERLERLSLLKAAVWWRDINDSPKSSSIPVESVPFPPSVHGSTIEKTPSRSGPHAADRVYALMGFFGQRIQPSYDEDELHALARLSMANDSDRIVERIVSLLPSIPHRSACWYADDDVYDAHLWDILPEIQVAGVTKNGALVVDGCRAASIRWKDFPEVAFETTQSVKRKVFGFIPYFVWPILFVGIAMAVKRISVKGGIALVVLGILLLLVSPRLIVISEAGRVVAAQPWLIGVKGALDVHTAAKHLYRGGNMGQHWRLHYTPSGSKFAVPDEGRFRTGSGEQYDQAKEAEAKGAKIYTLIDTYASAIYYFRAESPPTVCLFTGREGGLGRFVLCSEKCSLAELHKETVLRMPTEVSQRMHMCGWVALG